MNRDADYALSVVVMNRNRANLLLWLLSSELLDARIDCVLHFA